MRTVAAQLTSSLACKFPSICMNENRHKLWLLETRALASIFPSCFHEAPGHCRLRFSFFHLQFQRASGAAIGCPVKTCFALSARAILDIGCSLQQSRHFFHFFRLPSGCRQKMPSMPQPPERYFPQRRVYMKERPAAVNRKIFLFFRRWINLPGCLSGALDFNPLA